MRKIIQLLGCLAILAIPMTAHAEMSTAPDGKGFNTWRAQHDEMQQVRNEREALQGERDRLKMQCMNAKGQDHVLCDKKMEDLRIRSASVHEEMKDMHEKRESARSEHHEKKWKEHKASMKAGKDKGAKHHGKGKKPAAPPAEEPAAE